MRPANLKLGIQSFFELFHETFVTGERLLIKIACVPVTELPKECGYHGHQGTAFMFYFLIGEVIVSKHFCLGENSKECDRGCKMQHYASK